MSLASAIRVALAALAVNKGRSILTSLGIVIGIMAVIALVHAGSGVREALDERLDSVGKNLILIEPGGKTLGGFTVNNRPIDRHDVKALREDPVLRDLLVGVAESQHMLSTVTTATGANHHTTIVGGVPSIFQIRKWQTLSGNFYTESDVIQSARVCLLGDGVRKKLFPYHDDPVGQRVRIQGHTLRVIGVLAPKGRAPTGIDQDDIVFTPITTLQKMAGVERISLVVTAAKEQAGIVPAEQRIKTVLRERHGLSAQQDDDFRVSSVQEMSQLALFITDTLNYLIVVIASISLIVGGIGIMNIMLVSVTERTREIGIRMAVGATTSDIRTQFLIEAVVLALVGGLIGIILGLCASAGLALYLQWPVLISPFYVALAFGVAAAVGVFFGYYPAAKASKLDPIDALRYE